MGVALAIAMRHRIMLSSLQAPETQSDSFETTRHWHCGLEATNAGLHQILTRPCHTILYQTWMERDPIFAEASGVDSVMEREAFRYG